MKKSLFFTAGIISALVFLEITARLFLPNPPSVTIENLGEKPPEHPSQIEIFGKVDNDLVYPTFTGRRVKNNVKAEVKSHYLSKLDVEITTNSLGERYKELYQKQDNEYRILTIGDSITFADYLPEDQTYTYYIEKYLKQNPPSSITGKNIEVINAGVGSIGAENELAILSESAKKVEPDIVLLELYLNDAYESGAITLVKPPRFATFSKLINYLFYKISLTKAQKYQFSKTKPQAQIDAFIKNNPISDPFNKQVADNFEDWGFAFSPSFGAKIEQVLTVMKEVAKDNNSKFVVVFFPVKYQVQNEKLRNEPQKATLDVTQRLGITYFDLLPSLRDKYNQDHIDLYYDHAHPKAEGNDFIAQKISEFLRQSL